MLFTLPMVLPGVSCRLAYTGSGKAENKGRKKNRIKKEKTQKGLTILRKIF